MILDAVMWFFGCSKTKAKQIVRNSSQERIQLIVDGFQANARRCFDND